MSVPIPYSPCSTPACASLVPAATALTVITRAMPTARPAAMKTACRSRWWSSRRRYVKKSMGAVLRGRRFRKPNGAVAVVPRVARCPAWLRDATFWKGWRSHACWSNPCRPGRVCLGRAREIHVRVLVVEDQAEMAEMVATGLRRAQMAVDVALDGPSGLERALINDYDVLVLDRDLPGLHGDEICVQLIAAGRRSRVLMLTAAADSQDLVEGLSLGADDYLGKPFDFPVLVARIRALARRTHPVAPPVLRAADLVVDTAKRRASRSGRSIEFAPKEFGVLELLVASGGRTVSAEELLERVWDELADPFTNAVAITISRLRAKLGDPPLIETVSRSGYRIGG